MFKKILIANRGEIACRVIKTARAMGLQTVAVYSEADRDALHVSLADESVCIGPAMASESYLSIDRIVEACRGTSAEAVHPGYGFLSENAQFAERLQQEYIVFIGPGPNAIKSMGDKITAKALAAEAGVTTIPGHPEAIKNAKQAVAVAREIGYPVMLKASAGGGGKGMRVVANDTQCREGFKLAVAESLAAFGDDRLFLEKYIQQPRHIEIQILADGHGNVIHLGERECSLQRRHQKVIEEAPSPFLDDATRAAMGDQAVSLARAVDYQSAGTVEFIVDADRNFYFLEMNTRLQVEHPVTEFVTGLDLVELMIRIAAGEPLPISQADVKHNGWAIEARVYAEDPRRNFLPSTGRLIRYLPPATNESVRVDSGVREGGEVSMYYDPLISKVVTHAANRDDAIDCMSDALNEYYIQGVSHNIAFLSALIRHPRFREGDIDTNLIADEFADGFDPANAAADELPTLIAVAAAIHQRHVDRADRISNTSVYSEVGRPLDFVVVIGTEQHAVQTVSRPPRGCEVAYHGQTYLVESDWEFGNPLLIGTINDQPICVQVERHELSYRLYHNGAQVDANVVRPRAAELLATMPVKELRGSTAFLLSPMPGLLVELRVAAGDAVRAGQDLAVVEAMKMQNVLRADHDSTVAEVLAEVGETLAVEQRILKFE